MANPYEQFVQPDNPYARYLEAGAKGLIKGGPLGGMTSLMGEGQRQTAEAAERMAYGLGGKVTDATGSPGLGFVANVAAQAIPTILGGEAAKLTAPAFRAGAKRLMQSSLKPSKKELGSGKAKRAVQTMLDEGVNVSPGGVEKMRASVDDINDQLEAALAGSNATVNKNVVAGRLQDTMRKFENQVNPKADMQAIESAWNEFLAHPALQGRTDIPVQLAQKLKKGTYKSLGEKSYGELKGASTEAQKTLARGLKEEVAAAVPPVGPALAREADLINASKIANNRVLMDANKNPLGLGWLAQPWMIPMWMWDRSPLLKSMTARGLHSGSRVLPGAAAQAGIGALMAGQGQPPAGILSP